MSKSKYVKPKTTSADLNTPVVFYEFGPSKGPEPGDEMKQILFECFAEVYNPSMKDMEIINSSKKNTKKSMTLRIRDPGIDYQPSNEHKVTIHDFRFESDVWEIISAGLDPKENKFIKVIVGVVV